MPSTPTRRRANSRRTAMVLVSAGMGIMLFGLALAVILHDRDVLSICAVGLVPLAIGVGFLADYRMQLSEIQRLGLPQRLGPPVDCSLVSFHLRFGADASLDL